MGLVNSSLDYAIRNRRDCRNDPLAGSVSGGATATATYSFTGAVRARQCRRFLLHDIFPGPPFGGNECRPGSIFQGRAGRVVDRSRQIPGSEFVGKPYQPATVVAAYQLALRKVPCKCRLLALSCPSVGRARRSGRLVCFGPFLTHCRPQINWCARGKMVSAVPAHA
jgi:hypothetical protein